MRIVWRRRPRSSRRLRAGVFGCGVLARTLEALWTSEVVDVHDVRDGRDRSVVGRRVCGGMLSDGCDRDDVRVEGRIAASDSWAAVGGAGRRRRGRAASAPGWAGDEVGTSYADEDAVLMAL